MLISDLSRLKMLRVVERDKLEEILKEINLTNSTGFDMETQQKTCVFTEKQKSKKKKEQK